MILLIDTSGRVARVAVITDEQFLAIRECGLDPDLGKKILKEVDALLHEKNLTWTDIDRIAVHRGREGSSFMALRVGIVTAAMLAHGLGRELVPVSSGSPVDIGKEARETAAVEVIEPFYAM